MLIEHFIWLNKAAKIELKKPRKFVEQICVNKLESSRSPLRGWWLCFTFCDVSRDRNLEEAIMSQEPEKMDEGQPEGRPQEMCIRDRMPNTSVEEGYSFAERIRKTIMEKVFSVGSVTLQITSSFGVSSMGDINSQNLEEMCIRDRSYK